MRRVPRGAGCRGLHPLQAIGSRTRLAIATGDITRPIPTPIHDLRPARELCAECHTPGRFVDSRQIQRSYFLADEENTPMNLRMLINVGGRGHGYREGSGIHYHMFVAQKVEYIARDPQRQQIAWVKVTRADGSTLEYQDSANPIGESERASLEVRTMDCLDCHNRPAHRFTAPTDSVNDALAVGSDLARDPVHQAGGRQGAGPGLRHHRRGHGRDRGGADDGLPGGASRIRRRRARAVAEGDPRRCRPSTATRSSRR